MDSTDVFRQRSLDFMHWLRAQNGVSISPKVDLVDLRHRGAGRGVVALEDIEVGEELFCIPYKATLNPSTSDLNRHLAELKHMESWPAIILSMIYEHGKGRNSQWWSYFNVLPDAFDTLMHWSDSELEELRGSAVLEKSDRGVIASFIDEKLLSVVRSNPDLFGSHAADFKSAHARASLAPLVHRMGSLVMAYAFDVPAEESAEDADENGYLTDDEEDSQKAMVPMADMLNADGEAKNNSRLEQGEDGLRMVTIKPIRKGDECLNDYGACPRSDLLRRYGYVSDEYKIHDVVELSIAHICKTISEKCGIFRDEIDRRRTGDSFRLLKQLNTALHHLAGYDEDVCAILDETYDIPSVFRTGSEEVVYFDPALILTVQGLAADEQEKAALMDSRRAPTKPEDPKTRGLFLAILEDRLKEYPTTIAADQELLRRHDLSLRHRQAIEVRLGEKELLAKAAESLNAKDTADDSTDLNGSEPARKRRKM